MRVRFARALLAIFLLLPAPAWAETLVVGNKEADSVGFIDLARGEMIVTRPTGEGPHEVAV
ncbi:MAG: YncE family protein, partial [Alphaproteobacteria bacterium]